MLQFNIEWVKHQEWTLGCVFPPSQAAQLLARESRFRYRDPPNNRHPGADLLGIPGMGKVGIPTGKHHSLLGIFTGSWTFPWQSLPPAHFPFFVWKHLGSQTFQGQKKVIQKSTKVVKVVWWPYFLYREKTCRVSQDFCCFILVSERKPLPWLPTLRSRKCNEWDPTFFRPLDTTAAPRKMWAVMTVDPGWLGICLGDDIPVI